MTTHKYPLVEWKNRFDNIPAKVTNKCTEKSYLKIVIDTENCQILNNK